MAAENEGAKMLNLCYARFGHADRRVIKHMAYKDLVHGLDLNKKVKLPECGPCVEAKITNGPMKSSTIVKSVSGTEIHTDVAEMNVMSLGSTKYFVFFIEEASGLVYAADLEPKDDAASQLVKYVKWVERQTSNRVKRIALDGGKKYLKAAKTLDSDGIEIGNSARYTPQENG